MKKYIYSKFNILVERSSNFVILYNCYSGGLVSLEIDVYDAIRDREFTIEEIKHGEELLRNGFIVNKSINEFQRAKTIIENSIRNCKHETISFVIAPTFACNLNCVYCFQKALRLAGEKTFISEETLTLIRQYILNNINIYSKLKQIKITWFGGEPTLCYEKIVFFSKELKEELIRRNIILTTSMITNGTLLDETKLRILVQDCNLRSIQITVDGMESAYCNKKQTIPAVFYKVLDNIQTATKYTKTIVRINADKTNVDELKELVKVIYTSCINKLNLKFHFAQLREYDCPKHVNSVVFNDLEYFKCKEAFYSSIERYGTNKTKNTLPRFSINPYCGLSIGRNIVIDCLGNLYKCEHYIGDTTKIIGNIKDGVFYNDTYLKSLSLATDGRCENCNLFPCCNYAQCYVMHCFTGKNPECRCYKHQLEVIKLQVKKYLEVKQNGSSKIG